MPDKRTMHDNELDLILPDGWSISGLTIGDNGKDWRISKTQPWGGVSYSGNTITVKAGRHKTSEVADWFNDGLKAENMIPSSVTTDGTPGSLNFAIKAQLVLTNNTVTLTIDNFRFGQGSTPGSRNNWWMGGIDFKRQHGSSSMICWSKHNNRIIATKHSGNHQVNEFSLSITLNESCAP